MFLSARSLSEEHRLAVKVFDKLEKVEIDSLKQIQKLATETNNYHQLEVQRATLVYRSSNMRR